MKVRAVPIRRKVVEVPEDREDEWDYTPDDGGNSDSDNDVDHKGRGDAAVDETMDEDKDNIDGDDKLVGFDIEEDDADNWVTHFGFENLMPFSKYIASLYFTVSVVTTIGYGDIYPKTPRKNI